MLYSLAGKSPVLKGNNYIAPNAAVIGDVVIGKNSSIWWGCTLRGDNDTITLGENVNIQDGSVLHTDEGVKLTLEDGVSVGHLVMLHGCTVKAGALIGIKSVILNHAVIGEDCLIGANSFVGERKVIPPRSLVLGSPGKVVRTLTDAEVHMVRGIAKHYTDNSARYLSSLVPL